MSDHHHDSGTWFRSGYYQYSPSFSERRFWGRHYFYEPMWDRCVYSPFYFYCMLPPYLGCDDVIFVEPHHVGVWIVYDWRQPHEYRDRELTELDYELDDLSHAFMSRDSRAISYMLPKDGHVAIYMNDEYRYSLGSADFYDTMRDGIENVHTSDYHIVSVRKDGEGNARVIARHEIIDASDRTQVVYQTFRLDREGHDYVIREFGTSDQSPG